MKLRRILPLLLVLCILSPGAAATETPTPITTAEELASMEPEGSYILMADLDLTGMDWKPIDFRGHFDGNGHALLNLTLTQFGEKRADSWDGNRKNYDTVYAGFFGTLIDAEVKNLQLINVRGTLESTEPAFLGGLAGYAENTTIENCTVSGCLELRAHDRMFGVGGIVGFGSGYVKDCQADVTLITVDTDAQTKDEQFLGGIYGTGFMDVIDCRVVIDGYVSEHGYVHSGGLVGMYMDYPFGKTRIGTLSGNDVKGKITFFEDNTSRRAYCAPFAGENLVDWYSITDNTEEFTRDERMDYTLELRPEMCENPEYTQTVVASTCTQYGYTIFQCTGCGYCYADQYTPLQHTVTKWTVTKEATVDAEGESEGACDHCGTILSRTEPKLEPVPTTTAAPSESAEIIQPETTSPEAHAETEETQDMLLIYALWLDGLLLLLAILILLELRRRKRA